MAASSENYASIEPWMLRPSVADSWLVDYIARDADALTKALQKSLSNDADSISPLFNLVRSDTAAVSAALPATPTVSSLSGSDQDSRPKRNRVSGGRVSKRKSRASKRSQTTFITADPANFRQMVQQVTGVRFSGSFPAAQMAPVLRPEPQRMTGVSGGRMAVGAGCLPTLDTSAFLLDAAAGPDSVGSDGPGPFSYGPMDDASFASAGLDFETFSSFPTLESWKVM